MLCFHHHRRRYDRVPVCVGVPLAPPRLFNNSRCGIVIWPRGPVSRHVILVISQRGSVCARAPVSTRRSIVYVLFLVGCRYGMFICRPASVVARVRLVNRRRGPACVRRGWSRSRVAVLLMLSRRPVPVVLRGVLASSRRGPWRAPERERGRVRVAQASQKVCGDGTVAGVRRRARRTRAADGQSVPA